MDFQSMFQGKYNYHQGILGQRTLLRSTSDSTILSFAIIMFLPIKLFLLILVLYPVDMSIYDKLQNSWWEHSDICQELLKETSAFFPIMAAFNY